MSRRSMSRRAGLAAVMLLVAPLAAAQSSDSQDQPAGGFLAADQEMVQRLLRVRSREELARELDSARHRESVAAAELTEVESIAAVVRARLDVKRQEIDLLSQRIRLARREADADARAGLDRQKERERMQLSVFEAMRDAADSQVERTRAAHQFARVRIRLQEDELRLVEKREERVARISAPDPASRQAGLEALDREIHSLSRDLLSRIRDYARSSERLARTTEDLARANLNLLEAWERVRVSARASGGPASPRASGAAVTGSPKPRS